MAHQIPDPSPTDCAAVAWDGDTPLVCVRRSADHIGEHVTRDGRSFLVRATDTRRPRADTSVATPCVAMI